MLPFNEHGHALHRFYGIWFMPRQAVDNWRPNADVFDREALPIAVLGCQVCKALTQTDLRANHRNADLETA